jgi:hypothetical protein
MNEIGPGIAKIQSKTFAAGISACTSMYMYTARKNSIASPKSVHLSRPQVDFFGFPRSPLLHVPACAYEYLPHPGAYVCILAY